MIGHTTMEYVKAVVPYADNLKNKMTEGILKEALKRRSVVIDSRNFLNWKIPYVIRGIADFAGFGMRSIGNPLLLKTAAMKSSLLDESWKVV